MLEGSDIDFYFGGTLFEKFVLQGRFDDYRRFCEQHGARHVEVSNGTIDMSNTEKAAYIRKLAADFTVVQKSASKTPAAPSCCRRASGSTTSARTSTRAPRW